LAAHRFATDEQQSIRPGCLFQLHLLAEGNRLLLLVLP
jgi:hypothetical protein